MNQATQRKLSEILVLLLFFLSGALALVYQVVWTRMMMNVFGSTAVAVGTVLAAFMSGMALGSWYIGRVADRSQNCLLLYACLEFGIALTAIISHTYLGEIGPAHLAIHEFFGPFAVGFGVTRFFLAFLLVMIPTVLMGATLPVLTRFFVSQLTKLGTQLSTLYATNTFGAVTGVLVTGFYLIGTFGINVPVYIAVAGNFLIGSIALLVSLRISISSMPSTSVSSTSNESTYSRLTVALVLFGLGVSGFTSFAYEIYWTRSLVFVLGNSTYALTTMLSSFLTGIALGGYLIRFMIHRVHDRVVIFGWIQICLGTISSLALPLLISISDPRVLNEFLISISVQLIPSVFASFGVAFLVMLVPAVLIGATFPLVGQIVVNDIHQTGSSVGRIYSINTLGNVIGALLPGFILLSWLGIQKGILAMAILNVSVGLLILIVRLTLQSQHQLWRIAPLMVLFFVAIVMSRTPLDFQFPSENERNHHQTLFYREGPSATTKVYWDPRSRQQHISVDGIVIGGTGPAEFKQLLLAHLPKLLLPDVSSELTVGIGSGILAGESARHSAVKRITGVEIEPSVIAGASWFAKQNHNVLEDPRLTVVADDIGNFLRTTSDIYQVITADEKTADEYASNGFSYSLEYYELLRRHLAPGGLVAQWVPTTLPPTLYRMVLNTFVQSFPHTQLWYFLPAYKRGPFNTILIGSNERINFDVDHIRRQFADNADAYESLAPYGLTSAEALLPHFTADEKSIRDAVNDASLNSMEHPRYEFYYPWDYATDKKNNAYIANHELIIQLRRKASQQLLGKLVVNEQQSARLRQTFAAEDRYLVAFQKFLLGLSVAEQYRLFDNILALAPWNDSLRARIFAQYWHIASIRKNPSERARLKHRASSLYKKSDP